MNLGLRPIQAFLPTRTIVIAPLVDVAFLLPGVANSQRMAPSATGGRKGRFRSAGNDYAG